MESVTRIGAAESTDVAELAGVAAQTFPLACPPSVEPDNVASFIATTLSEARFAEYLADPRRIVLTAKHEDRIVGYAMLIRDDGDVRVELSKMYVVASHHGSGVATALMNAALNAAAGSGAASVWLGVNQKNERAQRFYSNSGFTVTGTRTFQLGSHTEHDYVMERATP